MAYPSTLVEALDRLPGGEARGFRFYGSDRQERYFPYEAMRAEAHRRAAFFHAVGLRKGACIALVLPENHEFVLSFLGATVGGFVPVPIFPRASFRGVEAYVDTLEHIVKASRAELVVCMRQNHDVVALLRERDGLATLPMLDVETDLGGAAPPFSPPTVTPDDLCFLQFTSGSTSKPKGVMVKHGNLIANTTSFLGPAGLDHRPDDIGVSWLPLFHDMGLIGFVLGTLIVDLPVVLMPTPTFARTPRMWLDLITKHRGTITYAPNFAYELVTKRCSEKDVAALDLSSLRIAGCGAEPIRARTLLDFAHKFRPAGFRSEALLPSYGMAESCLAITFHQRGTPMIVDRVDPAAMKEGRAVPSDAPDALEIVSCGVPFPGHELAIVDERGRPVGERIVGQILSKGPSVTSGYFENPEATAETFENGWLRTGDLGYIANGNLFVCGRIKDLIILRGANYHPQDLEWVVSDLPGVRRGNVVAFSVLRDGTERLVIAAEANRSDAARLKQEIAEALQRSFGLTPWHVAVCGVGTLPKTSSGKAQRHKTRTMWENGELAEHAVS